MASRPKLGEVKSETHEQARRRRRREHENEIADRALFIYENGGAPTMREARKQAREMLDDEMAVEHGRLDPTTGKELAQTGTGLARARKRTQPPRGGKAPHRSSRPTRSRSNALAKTSRRVVAPFGSAASAGWTFITGGLSLVLFYVLLRDAGTVSAFTDGATAGLRNLADPFQPLLPSKGEAAPPPPVRKVGTGRKPR